MTGVKCTLCGCEKNKKIDSTIRNADNSIYSMYRCEFCETHFLYPSPNGKSLEEYYDGKFREEVHSTNYYDKSYMDGVFNWFSKEAQIRVERIKKELKHGDSILEVGCSVGYFLDAVRSYVGNVYGTEWDSKALDYIRDRIPECYVATNPQDFGVEFDKIFLFHVLEHIGEPIEFLKELKMLLKPGGIIYVEVPNVDDVLVKTYKSKAFMSYYYKMAHLYNFNEKGLSYVMNHAGLCGTIDHIQRYDLSNHMVWLRDGVPGGMGRYKDIINEEVNRSYIESLRKAKQTDTLFARMYRD